MDGEARKDGTAVYSDAFQLSQPTELGYERQAYVPSLGEIDARISAFGAEAVKMAGIDLLCRIFGGGSAAKCSNVLRATTKNTSGLLSGVVIIIFHVLQKGFGKLFFVKFVHG